MTETTSTSNPATSTARGLLEQIDAAGLEAPQIEVRWFSATDEQAQQIVGVFADRNWRSDATPSTQWISTTVDGVRLTVFLAEERTPANRTLRGQHLINSAQTEAGVL